MKYLSRCVRSKKEQIIWENMDIINKKNNDNNNNNNKNKNIEISSSFVYLLLLENLHQVLELLI